MKSRYQDITLLRLDHPGANDLVYRMRRKFIASRAREFALCKKEVPKIAYTNAEQKTWQLATAKLATLHSKWACSTYLASKNKLSISVRQIPQLADISRKLFCETGFRLEPVEGLVDSKTFLSGLRKRVMLTTQYVRHHSRPDYTPEPDIIHELLGHAPMLMDKEFAAFSERIGRAAQKAAAQEIKMLENLYWFTVEFGLIREGKGVKAFGAGLLSSFGELQNAFSGKPQLKLLNIKTILKTRYTYSQMQEILFVIPSFRALEQETERFLIYKKL